MNPGIAPRLANRSAGLAVAIALGVTGCGAPQRPKRPDDRPVSAPERLLFPCTDDGNEPDAEVPNEPGRFVAAVVTDSDPWGSPPAQPVPLGSLAVALGDDDRLASLHLDWTPPADGPAQVVIALRRCGELLPARTAGWPFDTPPASAQAIGFDQTADGWSLAIVRITDVLGRHDDVAALVRPDGEVASLELAGTSWTDEAGDLHAFHARAAVLVPRGPGIAPWPLGVVDGHWDDIGAASRLVVLRPFSASSDAMLVDPAPGTLRVALAPLPDAVTARCPPRSDCRRFDAGAVVDGPSRAGADPSWIPWIVDRPGPGPRVGDPASRAH